MRPGVREPEWAIQAGVWQRGPVGLLCLLAALCVLLAVPACRSKQRPEPGVGGSGDGPTPAPRLAPVSKVESADAWQDLIAQRPSAVVIRGGRVWIDLGHPSAHKHLQLAAAPSPWRLAQDVGDRRAALLVGLSGALDIPLDGALSPSLNPDTPYVPKPGEVVPDGEPPPPTRGLAMAITMRALAPDQSVTVLWEERPLANLRVSQDWERRTLSLPNDVVVTGENRLRLHFRNVAPLAPDQPSPDRDVDPAQIQVSAAIESVEVGTLAAIKAGAPDLEVGSDYVIRSLGDEVEFEVPADRSLVYYLVPPRRARLRIEVAGKGSLEVLASTDADHRNARPPVQLLAQPLRAAGRSASVDLSGYGETPTRLEIRVRSTRGQAGAVVERDANGRIERGGALFTELDIVARRTMPVDRRDRTPRDVYVLALEGVRPDDLLDGALGVLPKSPGYPAVARFLADALVFERAYTLGAAAVPAHAGLLTSVVPPGHLTVRGTFVAEGQSTLAEVLDRAGYFTSSVSANAYFSNERGLTQGFADDQILVRSNTRGNDAQKVVLGMLEEIGQRPSPRFVYGVLNDAQAPYDPPSEVLAEAGVFPPEGAPAQHRTHMWVGRVRTGKIEPDRAQLEYVRRLYRGELQVIDLALGLLLDDLTEREELDEAVIVLVGVHGEEFLEHGGAGHGSTLFEESIHVPLAIRAPKLLAPGHVQAPVDLLDLSPTLTDLLGVAYDPRWQGESLVPLIDDPQPPPRLVVSYLGDGSRAAIIGLHKFVLGPGRGRESQHFFDLAADPAELADRIADGGIALRMVRTALAWQLPEQPQWNRPRWGTGANLAPAFALDHGL
ncbi:Choline-sulfatase [Enhygromyxa salina]|uniref:Choline-sulfatase n=1 Tax=Enhygromyxa salina TaxID=215803 RepID=A0A0C2CQL2_9BACT|nr:Choline-sulfatase [Enhygromyxa salina]